MNPPDFLRRHYRLGLLAIFAFACLLVGVGIWETTGLTGKDEYYLGLRTPLEMIARDQWLVPFLDGAPRIRKPPLLYWLARASYETFGVSLASARLVSVAFAALMVAAAAGIGRRLGLSPRTCLYAAALLLAALGLHTEGRRLMLDVPTAACSAAAFWALLLWLDKKDWRWLSLATLLLAAGALIKGPIVAIVCGGGLLGLLAGKRLRLAELRPHAPALLAHALALPTLVLPWFFLVRHLYPAASAAAFVDEVESRQLLSVSLQFLPGILQLALPWTFLFLVAAWRQRHADGTPRLLLVWFLATLLPFALVRTFDRYLVGSLLPAALFLAAWLDNAPQLPRWPLRLGAAIALLLGSLLAAWCFWFRLGGWYWLLAPALAFAACWWRTRPCPPALLATAAAYWIALLWGVFPAIGVNALPQALVNIARSGRTIALYDGPQPAMLPILAGRPLTHWAHVQASVAGALRATDGLVCAEADDLPRLQRELAPFGLVAREVLSYSTLTTRGSGLRFVRDGATADDWHAALATRSPAPLMSRVACLRLVAVP
jgi:4-amino-4-deoxy-L-arabinose transferase-like glycosyltransferase